MAIPPVEKSHVDGVFQKQICRDKVTIQSRDMYRFLYMLYVYRNAGGDEKTILAHSQKYKVLSSKRTMS